jgi:exonuclease V gamma subunit
MREVEVLHDSLLDILEADTSLNPRTSWSWTPEIETYAPLHYAVYETEDEDAPRVWSEQP